MECSELLQFSYTYFSIVGIPWMVGWVIVNYRLKKYYPEAWARLEIDKNSYFGSITAAYRQSVFYFKFEYLGLSDLIVSIAGSVSLIGGLLFVYGWAHILVVCGVLV